MEVYEEWVLKTADDQLPLAERQQAFGELVHLPRVVAIGPNAQMSINGRTVENHPISAYNVRRGNSKQ